MIELGKERYFLKTHINSAHKAEINMRIKLCNRLLSIGTFRQLLVASPSMLPQIKRLKKPEDIVGLPFIANSALREPLRWNFSLNEIERRTINTQASIYIDATLAVREAVRQGASLSVLPDYAVDDDLATGRLIHVVPKWSLPSGGIHAVFPSARFRPVKVRAFVDVLMSQDEQRYLAH